jgi:hypothetical protein
LKAVRTVPSTLATVLARTWDWKPYRDIVMALIMHAAWLPSAEKRLEPRERKAKETAPRAGLVAESRVEVLWSIL